MNETNKREKPFCFFRPRISFRTALGVVLIQGSVCSSREGFFFFDFQNIESRIRKDETHNNQKKIESILLEKYHLIIEANFFIISGLKLLKKANYRKILFFWAKKDNFC